MTLSDTGRSATEHSKVCAMCSGTFTSQRSDAMYCSGRCSSAARRGGQVSVNRQVLPAEFAETLRGMYSFRGKPSLRLRTVLALARAKGWTLTALSDALGITRERVRQLALAAPSDGTSVSVHIPEPPVHPLATEPAVPALTEAQASHLRNLHRLACASGARQADHPGAVASLELAALLNGYILDGHRISDLADCLGLTKSAVYFRLGRCGYRTVPPSQRYGPGPLAEAAQLSQRGKR